MILQAANAQMSIATDASLLRQFNKDQKFWAFGQTVQAQYHVTKKEAIYGWVSYYTNGKFKNTFTATAKDPLTTPVQTSYKVNSSIRYRQLSIGLKHYFKGSFDAEYIWSLYGYAGFGLLLGKAENNYSQVVDTAAYHISSPLPGDAAFKRLTLDAGLGVEMPLGTDIYLYTEVRTWLPTTHYPSHYLYRDNRNIPSIAAVNLGIRITIQ
jgi:hypothetical protein